jgi:hypothetical protein
MLKQYLVRSEEELLASPEQEFLFGTTEGK